MLEARAEARPRKTATVVVRASLRRGRHPPPGAQLSTYHWRDLMDGDPPRRRVRGGGAYVVYHGTEQGADVRVSYATVVSVEPGGDVSSVLDDRMQVEERLTIQRRPLQELVDREREFSDALALRMWNGLARGISRQRGVAMQLAWWIVPFALAVLRFESRVGHALITAMRGVMRGIVDVPDAIITRSISAYSHLSTRMGRRGLWRALQDPTKATPFEKTTVLLLITATLVATVMVLSNVFSLIIPDDRGIYKHIVSDTTASLLGTLALPIPAEPMLVFSVLKMGVLLGIVGLFLGKMIGSWMLYILGDALHGALDKQTAGKPRIQRAVASLKANANRTGFWWLILINSIPLMPDMLVYAFAVSGMRYRSFMWGIALGTLLKFGAIAAGVVFVGPERVNEILADPIGAFR